MRATLQLTPILLLLALSLWAARPAETEGTIMGLKPGAGRPLVIGNCLPCHSTAIIAANHLTRTQWDKTITQMEKVNGMRPLAPDLRRQILDYLERTQRSADRGLDTGKQSPWASPLYRPNPLWPW